MSIKMVQMRRYKELTMRYIDVDSYGGIYEHKDIQMGRYKELTMRYIDVYSYGGIHEHKDGTDWKVQRINNEIHRRG